MDIAKSLREMGEAEFVRRGTQVAKREDPELSSEELSSSFGTISVTKSGRQTPALSQTGRNASPSSCW
jgi:hypothetical protein